MKKVLFVCTGNTCRSPMAEYIFNMKARNARLDWKAESAGVSVFMPMSASHNAVIAIEKRGGDMSNHVSKSVTEEMMKSSEAILCMTSAHAKLLLERFPNYSDKIGLLAREDISDPFGGNEDDYERTAQEIEAAVDILLKQIGENYSGEGNS